MKWSVQLKDGDIVYLPLDMLMPCGLKEWNDTPATGEMLYCGPRAAREPRGRPREGPWGQEGFTEPEGLFRCFL